MHHYIKYIILAIAGVLTTACRDTFDPNIEYSNTIKFHATVSGNSGWNSGSRCGDGMPVLDYDIMTLASDQSADSMYLHASVTEWGDADIDLNNFMIDSEGNVSRSPGNSRTSLIDSPDKMPENIFVSAFHYDTWDASLRNNPGFNYFKNQPARKLGGGNYEFNPPVYWPESGKLRFFAWSCSPEPDPVDHYVPGVIFTQPWMPNDKRSALFVKQIPREDADPDDEYKGIIHADFEKQNDVLVAWSGEIEANGSRPAVNLHFKHLMTGIRFKTDNTVPRNIEIKEIRLKNVMTQGYYTPTSMNSIDHVTSPSVPLGYWDHWYFGSPMELRVQVNKTVGKNEYIIDPDKILMVPPQIFGNDNAEVQIFIRQAGSDHDEMMFGYIKKDTEWKSGTIVTYTLSYDNWWSGLQATQPLAYPYSGGSHEFKLSSFDVSNFESKDLQFNPLDWEADFCFDHDADGNPISFMEAIPESGPNSWLTFKMGGQSGLRDLSGPGTYDESTNKNTPIPITAIVAPNTEVKTYDLDKDLKMQSSTLPNTRPQYPEAQPFNLAACPIADKEGVNNTIIDETANCYVVDRPGWFMFPIVYGNAIRFNNNNRAAYAPGSLPRGNALNSTTGALPRFYHAKGKINHPIIGHASNADGTPTGAKVVWQDAEKLISQVKYVPNVYPWVDDLDGNKPYTIGAIKFYVDQSTIKQGNAVVALTDASGNVMWSWHLWVTTMFNYANEDLPMNVDLQTSKGSNVKMMPVNLGWVSYNPIDVYQTRKCTVRFKTKTTAQVQRHYDVVIMQRRLRKHWYGHSPFYQWGRKDPFQGGAAQWNSARWWDSDGNVKENHHPPFFDMGDRQSVAANPTSEFTSLKLRVSMPNHWHTIQEYPADGTVKGNSNMFLNLWDAFDAAGWPAGSADAHGSSWKPGDNSGAPDDEIEKTVYDPCPQHYKVPKVTAYTGFTSFGNNVGLRIFTDTWSEVIKIDGNALTDPFSGKWVKNNYFDDSNPKFIPSTDESIWRGFITRDDHTFTIYGSQYPVNYSVFSFLTDVMETKQISLPAVGYRDWRKFKSDGTEYSATTLQVGSDGYYWTAKACNRDEAYYLCFMYGRNTSGGGDGTYSPPHINPCNHFINTDGYPIRPCFDPTIKTDIYPAAKHRAKRR